MLAIANTGFATSCRSERNIAIYIVIAILAGAGGIQVFSGIASSYGLFAVFLALATVSAVALLAAAALPVGRAAGDMETVDGSGDAFGAGRVNLRALVGVVGVLLYFTALGLVWGNLKILGLNASVEASAIDHAISLSLIFGVFGGIGGNPVYATVVSSGAQRKRTFR